MLTKKNLHTNL